MNLILDLERIYDKVSSIQHRVSAMVHSNESSRKYLCQLKQDCIDTMNDLYNLQQALIKGGENADENNHNS